MSSSPATCGIWPYHAHCVDVDPPSGKLPITPDIVAGLVRRFDNDPKDCIKSLVLFRCALIIACPYANIVYSVSSFPIRKRRHSMSKESQKTPTGQTALSARLAAVTCSVAKESDHLVQCGKQINYYPARCGHVLPFRGYRRLWRSRQRAWDCRCACQCTRRWP